MDKNYYICPPHCIFLNDFSELFNAPNFIPTIYKCGRVDSNMKIDPYNNQDRYMKWKEKNKNGIPGISRENSSRIKQYFDDMENGLNTSSIKRGARSFLRMNSLRVRILFLVKQFEARFELNNILDITEEQVGRFFVEMRTGKIKKKNGGTFISVKDYVQDFKAFWHWWMKINKKKDIEIKDITTDLDTSVKKPNWVYMTEEEVKKLCENAKYEYKVLIMFLFDTGIRSPTELMNVMVSDLFNDCKELHIRDEVSKTFGRKIKLLLCSDLLKGYIKSRGLSHDSYLFDITPHVVNNYLKRLSRKIFQDKVSLAGEKYCNLSMYDLRHCSCCYWLPRYKSESALKYRFGWKKTDKIHYYSELLGMKDTIAEEDMLLDVTKTEIEKRLAKSEKKNEMLEEELGLLKNQIKQINEVTSKIHEKMRDNGILN